MYSICHIHTWASMQVTVSEFGGLSNTVHSPIESTLLQDSGSVLGPSITRLAAFTPFGVWTPFTISLNESTMIFTKTIKLLFRCKYSIDAMNLK